MVYPAGQSEKALAMILIGDLYLAAKAMKHTPQVIIF